ncbi:AraC family transcriptional regulator [Labedella phragmitis]|uniref:AraC family transcriptional regulator n=1 Tax=Labedella phragmitis TaxID=2498849 RepID=A0A3S3Z931_9MICO|nr:helix-turn-helix transcriptional regulator [Labedella phragmitis]RWZ51483.1 AraC family transcriptional regulator [Labedella phragmitis]
MPAVQRRDVVTSDREDANELFRAAFPGISLVAAEDDRPFRFRHSVAGDGRLMTYSLVIAGSATGHGTMPEGIAVGGVRRGRFDVAYGHDVVDTARPYLRPPGESTIVFDDAHVDLVTLDLEAFSAAARRYVDDDRLPSLLPRPGRTAPLTPAAARSWRIAADRALATVTDEEAVASALVRERLFDMMVRVLLTSFEIVPGRPWDDGSAVPAASGVRRAIAYLDEHIAEHVTLPDVAEAARLSVRSVQHVFRRHVGTTPLGYLRDRRLDAVRLELIASDPAVVTVAEVARRWGFAHLSRFSQAYHARFGEYPRMTIRS